ncbi:MAG TPA: T9SS type A sorting domain-containing protein, partial [Flavobacteriales bacterium]|nr:T9SS type A sorting domain-containing protein [Flavobacteriales bacterium]
YAITYTTSTNDNPCIVVYTGACGSLATVGCVNATGTGTGVIETYTFTASTTTTYRVRILNYGSGNMSGTTCVNSNACSSITNIAACGTSVTTNLTGTGVWNVTTCGFTTSGNEAIYSYTPTTTGTYSINVTSASGGFIDFFWMNSTTGCGPTGWTCIDDISSTGTFGSMSWTAGQTYYILLDAEPTSATSFTWNIACPPAPATNPCLSITNIPACGGSNSVSLNGTGFTGWSPGTCGFTTPGDEQIFSFTPATSGSYSINVTSASGGFIDYFWINSTSGCSPSAGWNCIDDISSTGTYGSMSWVAGQTYYILLDAEGTFGPITQTFSINSPGPDPCLSVVNIPDCGITTMTANLTNTAGAWSFTGCTFSGTPGDEQLYTFTPATSGNYNINISSFSGPSGVDFLYVDASFGCSSTAPWTCFDNMFGTGNTSTISLTAGVTYYILLDAEFVGAYTLNFMFNCPGTAVTAGDCSAAVNVCTNLTFAVDPSGFGSVNEIPPLGTAGNPDLVGGDGVNSAWGNDNWGCLRSGELNSTWMLVNIATSGMLNFSFGTAGSGSFNCYDWIMYPYTSSTCSQIPTGGLAPVRCNWNSPCEAFTGIASTPPAGGDPGNFEPDLAVTAGQQYIICFSNFSSAFTNVPLNFFGTATVSCTPLPVELTSFNGNKKGKDVLLYWHTQTENEVSHYTVMHSADGVNFSPVGNVVSNGSNESADYDFTHYKPVYGTNYYRLVMVDANNQSKESGIVVINFMEDELVIGDVRPNPSVGLSYITIDSKGSTDMYIAISDISGKVIREQKVSLVKGSNTVEINTSLLAKGVYHFAVSNSGTAYGRVQKLVVE